MSDDPVLEEIRHLVALIKIEPVRVIYGDTSTLKDLSRAGRMARRQKSLRTK